MYKEPPVKLSKILSLKQNTVFPEIIDVELNNVKSIQDKFNILECHLVLYPLSRKIKANNFHFYPYEEYIRDINENKKSAYNKISDSSPRIFGLLFSALVVMIVMKLNPQDFYSVEAIVSAFGAYMLGKDLWVDVERWLVNVTKKYRLRMMNHYFDFQLDKNTTLTNYAHFAKSKRYGASHILSNKMDYIEHSNSQTVRMLFDLKDMEIENYSNEKIHILSIHLDEELLEEFKKEGYIIGVKLNFIKKHLGFNQCFEVFQSINNNVLGCLNEKKQWLNNCIFIRRTLVSGRLKFYQSADILENKNVIEFIKK